jgi:hypothetical protein
MARRLAPIVALLLVIAACGDDSATTTSSTAAPDTTTTTQAEATTTMPEPDSGMDGFDPDDPLVAGIGGLFEDPFFGSGFHEMRWMDEQNILISTTSIGGGDDTSDFLAVASLVPPPETTGVAASGQLLVEAYVDTYSGDIIPVAVVLYTLEDEGWVASVVIGTEQMEAALLGTTDYAAIAPGGPVSIRTMVSTFDWVARTFAAGVSVFDYFNDSALVYEGEVECTIDPFECTTLSDDGILRSGDEGEAVEALQQTLIDLGYLGGPVDGRYGPGTSSAVSAFQRDFWLDVDGRAGPQTLGLLDEMAAGTSPLVLIRNGAVGSTPFGAPAEGAYAELFSIFGVPDDNTGWFVDACDGNDWLKATWAGFTAIFTDRDGFRALDGWAIEDLSNLPEQIRVQGGMRSTWTWDDFEAAGAEFDPFYGGFFYMPDYEYNNGRFVDQPGDAPEPGAAVQGFGAGTGAFVSC